ncbi:MAG: Zn-ribbon containing protein [Thermoplasmata archaeon]
MPHQCLKCGSVFADGSPQILRGCPGCGGTRFFYTDKPMSDDERNILKEKANKDIKHLIREMLTSSDAVPIKIDEKSLEKDEWMPLGVTSEAEPKEVDVQGRLDIEKRIMKSIEDLKFPKEGRSKKFRFTIKGGIQKELKKSAVKVEPTASEAEEPKKDDRVAVITIDEEGVYDIDVERLLENSPIVVSKDGTYMVHLPSVFNKVRKK